MFVFVFIGQIWLPLHFIVQKIAALRIEELPFITRAQLALRNGQDKPEIWVAYKHLVYDVSPSRLWRNGKHYEHWAGQDLTDEFPDAPHTEQVFDKFPVIGRLKI